MPIEAGSPRACRADGAGTANGRRAAGRRRPGACTSRPGRPVQFPRLPSGRQPMTWSHWSMASRSGSRCSFVQGSSAVVTSTSGKRGSPQAAFQCTAEAILSRPGRRSARPAVPVAAIRSASGAMMPSADSAGKSVSRMIRIPAFGNGSRRRCSAKGSSLTSVVVIRTPGRGHETAKAAEHL